MPPRPTQNAEYVELFAVHVTAGCTHVPLTSVNVPPLTAYPAQLLLAATAACTRRRANAVMPFHRSAECFGCL